MYMCIQHRVRADYNLDGRGIRTVLRGHAIARLQWYGSYSSSLSLAADVKAGLAIASCAPTHTAVLP